IPWRLFVEEAPRRGVRPEATFRVCVERRAMPSFVRVDARPLLVARRERGAPGRMRQAEFHQLVHALDVDGAPRAARRARREAYRVALGIERSADAVDPAETQCLVDRFGPGDARPSRAALVESHHDLR